MKNQEAIPLTGEGEGPIGRLGTGLQGIRMKATEALCLADARSRTFLEGSDEGMATAEYAIVLVAATGFAGLLVAILKSDMVKDTLVNLVKSALSVRA